MPNKPQLEGKDPNELVYIHVKIPLWLKRKLVAAAADRGQDLTAYVIATLVEDLGPRKK
jgi:hypothetical protein